MRVVAIFVLVCGCWRGTETDDADTCRSLATEEQQQTFAHELEVFEVSEDGQ